MDKKLIQNTLMDAQNALDNYAEQPTPQMESYSCHKGICSMWECGRCSKAIYAYGVSRSIDYALAELER